MPSHRIKFLLKALVLLLLFVCGSQSLLMNTQKNFETCLATGLDILRETRNIQRFRATFDLETRKVYYKVNFCKNFSMCFASTIDQKKVNEDVVNKIESWAKIIRVIQGKRNFTPYIKDTHSKEFGGPRDYYNCTKQFYIITHKPTQAEIRKVTKNIPSKNCLSNQLCSRTCLHKTEKRNRCHEVRIICNFKCSAKKRKGRDVFGLVAPRSRIKARQTPEGFYLT
ncbi:uncharacterized protein LOC135695463 [Rhopilema esculentum]|uniref:uncharacterized protein LOC135695463 n=1 Tax=Rhopilema esculentum TaxID=499914 RepID=UPI0031DE67D0